MKEIQSIKVLNIAQPNAHYVMHSGKNIENRSMISYFRGTIAIYASATYSKARFEDSDIEKEECQFGCILGFVDMVDCIIEEEVTDKTKDWFHGPYGYLFENVRVLDKPITVSPPKGAIVWWTLEGKQAEECLKQIDMDSYKPVVKINVDPDKPKIKNNKSRGELIPSVAISSILGIEPITQKRADEMFVTYLEENNLIKYPESEDEKIIITTDKKIKKLLNKENLTPEECFEIVSNNLEFCSDDQLVPSKLLEPIIGAKPITLKNAIKKFMEYMDKHELYDYIDDDDEVGCIISDENIKNLTKKDELTFEEFGVILMDNLKTA